MSTICFNVDLKIRLNFEFENTRMTMTMDKDLINKIVRSSNGEILEILEPVEPMTI